MRSKSKAKRSWPVTYRWLAAGTIAAYTAVGCVTVGVAAAQDAPQTSGSQELPSQTHPFNIPPDALDIVLKQFEDATTWHVDVKDPGMLQLSSPGVSGVFRAEKALEQLVKGTGLSYRITGAQTALLELSRVAHSVDVTTSVSALAASTPKYSDSLLDTPQTVSVVPQHVMDEQNVTTLRDALRNVAGISLAAGEGGSQGGQPDDPGLHGAQ